MDKINADGTVTFELTNVKGEKQGSVTLLLDAITRIEARKHCRTQLHAESAFFHVNATEPSVMAHVYRAMAAKLDAESAAKATE